MKNIYVWKEETNNNMLFTMIVTAESLKEAKEIAISDLKESGDNDDLILIIEKKIPDIYNNEKCFWSVEEM